MEYKINIDPSLYHLAILKILNATWDLTKSELKVLSTLLDNNLTVVDGRAREIVRIKLNKSKFNINNCIKVLVDKHLLLRNEDSITINPSILTIIRGKKISFEFITNDNSIQN